MAHVILFDNEVRERLLPLTFTRPVCELRVGILTIREKWEKWLSQPISYITQDYLAGKYTIDYGDENYVINGAALPSVQLCTLIRQMDFNEAFVDQGELIVAKLDAEQFEKLIKDEEIDELRGFELEETEYLKVNQLSDLFRFNDAAIRQDFELLTNGRTSAPLSDTNRVLGRENIFVEEGATVEFATINATNGPVYIGKNATIMEGCLIRGSFALCEHATLKMGAKIYEGTTVGPWCKAAGEISNSILLSYSNKAHDGFLGNSYIGEWCNIGADTTVSNLKNNYAEVKLWDYSQGRFVKTGSQFCGLIMGDHSKIGINSMLNTGTVIGVSANVFGSDFPRNFIPSFSWGGHNGFKTYRTDKAFETAELMMQRRKQILDTEERIILLRIFEDTAKYRPWEKDA